MRLFQGRRETDGERAFFGVAEFRFFERLEIEVEVHDAQRPFKGGAGSYDGIMKRVAPLLKMQQKMQVSARVTVTPGNLRLRETLDGLLGLGFHSAGFSPMLHAPSGHGEMDAGSLQEMLRQRSARGRC